MRAMGSRAISTVSASSNQRWLNSRKRRAVPAATVTAAPAKAHRGMVGLGRESTAASSVSPGRATSVVMWPGTLPRGAPRNHVRPSYTVRIMTTSEERQEPDRNLALELVRVTEAAAMAAARWMGRGDKEGADGAAVDAMRVVLGTVAMDGIVVIGEGEKDEAPMLYNGENIGDGTPPSVDIAVDP